MPLITDPDALSQGNTSILSDLVFVEASGNNVKMTSAGTQFGTVAAGDFFELRGCAIPGNDGLYIANNVNITRGNLFARKITGPLPVNDAADVGVWYGSSNTTAGYKSVMFDTTDKRIYLLEQGNLDADGATEQALYSFCKKRWKDDNDLIKHDFPMVAITPEQFEFVDDWNPEDNPGDSIRTRKVIRTGGWSEISANNLLQRQYSGIITLGTFVTPGTETAYYQLGNDSTDTGGAIDFDFAGPVNEAILVYRNYGNPDTCTFASTSTITRATGSFITDGYQVGGQVTIENSAGGSNNGTFTITAVVALTLTVSGTPLTASGADTNALLSVDNRNVTNMFIRIGHDGTNGRIFDSSDLAAIGVTAVDNKVFRFPLANSTDLNVDDADAGGPADTQPWTDIGLKFFDGVYSKDIDSATNRSFGAVIDVGTHSGIDGQSYTNTLITTADGGIPETTYDGGTLSLYEGTDENNTFTVANTGNAAGGSVGTEIHLTGATAATEGPGLSFSIQRATPVVATLNQIYERVQYLLRQDADINYLSSNTIVSVGRTTGELLEFVGSTLKTKTFANPASLTTDGVAIEGFDSNDTNDIVQRDNSGTERTFPFVAAGTINFNTNLQNDTDPEFWMFFTYTIETVVSDLVLGTIVGANSTWTSAGSNIPSLTQFEYVTLSGASHSNNNVVWEVVDASPATNSTEMRKYNGLTAQAESSFSGTVRENPVDSPSAIIVDNNSGADIVGAISGPSTSFDFDYDNNAQGGRTAATDAEITLKAIGLETAQDAITTGTITRATGLSFSLVSGLERNYTT